uniref:small ribosomal subunit protein bS18m n=1 Tax=Semicossyphus pulcher TaxID=241346 RepID=UPI0037E85C16
MLALRGLQRLKPVLSPHGNASLRSLTATSNVVQQKNDVLVKMDNPFKEPKKGCILCNVTVDYKNVQLLSQFISPHTGRIYGRHITGLCGRKQKEISKAIKKAHSMGFMSVTHKHPQFMKDPNICSIKHLD